ncbi:cytochrome c3 family protein [Marinobacter fonticola]|uniref:cytochrome c3 family protein n=1 Tax=Marinobacter fonticola TaxID=2603215 RepID=UPI0011E6C4CF|nr:cytochrome c3 family protein [Marinobacter fonticola]
MPQLFRRRTNGYVQLFLALVALTVLLAGVALSLNGSPYATGQNAVPEQPVPFSHQHHVGGLGIDCQYCHTSVDRSSFAGLPDTQTCMTCHSQLWTNADMLAPVRQSLARKEPIEWVRVHDLPDHVYFNHQMHVNNGVGCESCHGRVDRMPLMRQDKPLTMKWCLECHRNPGPRLRPKDKITEMGYSPDSGRSADDYLALYDIHTDRMTECSTCHR